MTTVYQGTLEVDNERGVVYFHLGSAELVQKLGAVTLLRVSQLPTPIPKGAVMDVTNIQGAYYKGGTP